MACTRVFLDVGANIGVNMRFLYEPKKYPKSRFMVPMMDKVLGRNRENVCYYGFEANVAHHKRLEQLKVHFKTKFKSNYAHIWNQPVLAHDDNITLYHAGSKYDYKNKEFSFSAMNWSKSAIPVQSRAFNFPKWFASMKFDPTTTTVLMKVDIEGSEYEVLTALLVQGLLCKIHTITIEWHPGKCQGSLCNAHLVQLTRLLPNFGCNVTFVERDDESYLHDGQPLN